jgi:hypothetical protein
MAGKVMGGKEDIPQFLFLFLLLFLFLFLVDFFEEECSPKPVR